MLFSHRVNSQKPGAILRADNILIYNEFYLALGLILWYYFLAEKLNLVFNIALWILVINENLS